MRIKVRRVIAMPLIFILMFTSCLYIYPKQVEAKESSLYQGNGFEVKFYLDSVYEDGYNARIELTNTSSQTIEDWTLDFSFTENISSAWNGMFSKLEDGAYQIQNAGWNQDIKAGETITFGFSGSCTQTPNEPTNYKLLGKQCTADPKDYYVTCDLVEQWSSGYIVKISIKNLTAYTIKDWMLEFTSQNELESMWGASISNNTDGTYQVRNNNNNQNISAYNTVSFNYMVTSNTYNEPSNYKLFYQSLDSNLVESLAPTTSTTEEPIKSAEPTVTEEPPTANPTESILPTVSEVPDVSEIPVSSETPKESEDPEEIDMTDTDGDGLIDVLEDLIGTDLNITDTDGDLLTDYEEVYLVGTDPLLIDSDGNGIMDANDDFDLDGLSNKEELKIGTSAVTKDTDYDGLNDGEEKNQYGTDPLNEDTDKDTITDGDEILLGLNPLLADSDGDGISDNEEKVEQTFSTAIEDEEKSEVTNVEVEFAGTGNIQNTTEITNVYGVDLYSSDLVGLVGVPIEIETDSEFDNATITFSYDENKLGEVEEENLVIMWYDEENHDYVQMDSTVDQDNNTVSCDTTHFSVYTLIDKKAWDEFWSEPIQYHYLNYMDIAVVCENTREMYDLADAVTMIGTNVAGNMTILDHICEIEYGKDAYLEFEFGRESEFAKGEINDDFYDALVYRAEKNREYVLEQGYNASKGIELAIQELNKLNSGNEKAILLLSSGNGLDNTENAVKLAKENNISITTVNFNNTKEYSSTFKTIAEKTDGKYIDTSSYNINRYDDLCEIATNAVKAFKRRGMKDLDGDGLKDIYELYGVKASNGTIIKTDYKKADMDSDELTDKEELNLKQNKETGEVVAFLCSLPTKKDSDEDGLIDSRDAKPNKAFSKRFILADGLDYFPYNAKKDYEWSANEVNYEMSNATYVDNITKSELLDIKDRAKTTYKTFGALLGGKLLKRFVSEKGGTYEFSCRNLLTNSHNASVHFDNNVEKLIKVCKESVKKKDTLYFATSPNYAFTGTSSADGIFETVRDIGTFISINSSLCGMTCKCTNKGSYFTMELKYYILDYYDWDYKNDVKIGLPGSAVSSQELYKLEKAKMAKAFRVVGSATYYIDF